jgi:hypothetical protein
MISKVTIELDGLQLAAVQTAIVAQQANLQATLGEIQRQAQAQIDAAKSPPDSASKSATP